MRTWHRDLMSSSHPPQAGHTESHMTVTISSNCVLSSPHISDLNLSPQPRPGRCRVMLPHSFRQSTKPPHKPPLKARPPSPHTSRLHLLLASTPPPSISYLEAAVPLQISKRNVSHRHLHLTDWGVAKNTSSLAGAQLRTGPC